MARRRPFWFTILLMIASSAPAAAEPRLVVERARRELVLETDAGVRLLGPVGIGRGGLALKRTMSDLVTPTGAFEVELILHRDPARNRIAPAVRDRLARAGADTTLLRDAAGLATLFEQMNGIDFDGDGKPDRAYGDGYIGLGGEGVVTGPKLVRYRNGPLYWFSIALHGTPNPGNIGKANSGGCVHLAAPVLDELVERELVTIGTRVLIRD